MVSNGAGCASRIGHFDDNEPIPLPSAVGTETDYVEIPLSVASKVLLLNVFLESNITQQELANRIGRSKQEITRLFDLNLATKIDAVQIAVRAVGKELSLTML